MSGKFRFAVVGCGMAARPHALALQALADEVSVTGVHCRDARRCAAFANKYGFTPVADIERLARASDVDALLLLTPPDARQGLIELFASHGKHVLCEKPLERSAAAAADIVAGCARHQVQLGVVFQNRFHDASRRLATMLAADTLGELRAVRIEVPWWRDQAYYDEPGRGTLARDGGGVLISQAIHTLDLALSLAGPVKSVQAIAATTALHRLEAEDFVAAGLEFACGAPGALVATTAAYPGAAEAIRLELDHASVELTAGMLRVRWRAGHEETFGDAAATGGGADPMAFPFTWHRDLIMSFVTRVSAGEPPLVSGSDALAVQELIDALLRSARQGTRVQLAPA